MLTRAVARMAAVLTLAAGSLIAIAGPAHADYIYCPPDGTDCYIVVTDPGSGGNGGGGGTNGNFECTAQTAVWGCYDELYGWWSPADGCYWRKLTGDDVPPATDPAWRGNYPDGAIYRVWCVGYISGTGNTWRATNPPGYGGDYNYLNAATQAVERLRLGPPDIHMTPNPTTRGLVGLPVWLWTPAGATTWATPTPTQSATAGGITVSANATATQIVWDMGNGDRVTCHSAGTQYTAAQGARTSPDCGYRGYPRPSRLYGGRYTVTATTTWQVHWWVSGGGSGVTGDLTVTRTATTWIIIDEMQAVTW